MVLSCYIIYIYDTGFGIKLLHNTYGTDLFNASVDLNECGKFGNFQVNYIRAGKRGAARQQCCQKEIDRTISDRRILVNSIIFVLFLTDND